MGEHSSALTSSKPRRQSSSLVSGLLGFLDRNLGKFSPRVRDSIGMGVLVLLMIYVLNGFVGPTFVRGTLYVFEKERNQKVPAVNYQIRLRDEHLFTNSYGEWVLPIYRGGIPSKVRLRFHRPGGDYIDRYSFTGPWPIWHALSPME